MWLQGARRRTRGNQGVAVSLTERRVRFTATAQRQVRREKAWWLENRAYVDVFAEEIESSLQILAVFPGVGTTYIRKLEPSASAACTSARLTVIFITVSMSAKLSFGPCGEPVAVVLLESGHRVLFARVRRTALPISRAEASVSCEPRERDAVLPRSAPAASACSAVLL